MPLVVKKLFSRFGSKNYLLLFSLIFTGVVFVFYFLGRQREVGIDFIGYYEQPVGGWVNKYTKGCFFNGLKGDINVRSLPKVLVGGVSYWY